MKSAVQSYPVSSSSCCCGSAARLFPPLIGHFWKASEGTGYFFPTKKKFLKLHSYNIVIHVAKHAQTLIPRFLQKGIYMYTENKHITVNCTQIWFTVFNYWLNGNMQKYDSVPVRQSIRAQSFNLLNSWTSHVQQWRVCSPLLFYSHTVLY